MKGNIVATTSWVLREKGTKRVIAETFDPKKVAALNTIRYEAVPILDYLGERNLSIKNARH
jgi:hypothetical protein